MEFINFEATEEYVRQPLTFSDEDEITNDEMEYFIDNSEQPREDVSFYRQFDPEDLEQYHKSPNQEGIRPYGSSI